MARPPVGSDAIVRAATQLFLDRGYAGATVRDIAALAGVDPAIVIRRFGSKESLFLASVRPGEIADAWRSTLDGPLPSIGERCVAALLDARGDTRGVFLALLRASDAEGVGGALREAHEQGFVAPLRERLGGGPDADVRARLAAAAAGGMLYALWAVGDEALGADRDALVARYGTVVQAAIDAPVAG